LHVTSLENNVPSALPRLRWRIAILLFASTVINYIDRQTLSVMAPFLQRDHGWSNSDFATVLIAFRIGYTIMQGLGGRLLDVAGTRLGLTISVAFYSVAACLTSLVTSLNGFRICRFLLGCGEGPNWPGATKATSEWFPPHERAWSVALFDSGSSIGGAIAPFLVLALYKRFGDWRAVFLVTGSLGFLWLIVWRWLYYPPQQHPRLGDEERALILGTQESAPQGQSVGWGRLLRYRQTWGIVLGRALLDPYWFLIADWFAIYLSRKGFSIESSALGFWAPFLGADLGNFFGGGLSSWWIRKGWSVGRARRTVLGIFGPSMLVLIFAAFTSNYVLLLALFTWSTFAYAACSTMFLSLPADVFDSRAVASVSGMGGTAAGIGTLISTLWIGRVADRISFEPVIIVASIVPCIATVIFLTLVRNSRSDGLIREF
jgi:ACS family hexuronate transporter-like MFS transporter